MSHENCAGNGELLGVPDSLKSPSSAEQRREPTAADPDGVEERLEKAGLVEAPDGGYGWVVVAASFMVRGTDTRTEMHELSILSVKANLVVDGILFSIAETIVPLWEKEFSTTTSAATLATSLLGGCYLLSGSGDGLFFWSSSRAYRPNCVRAGEQFRYWVHWLCTSWNCISAQISAATMWRSRDLFSHPWGYC